MARVTYVKAAQQRYATVPVLNEDGTQKRTLVTRKDGSPKLTRRGGREIWRNVTIEDKSQPVPNRTCGKCGTEIEPGMPYKWIKPKSGPYGGRLLVRCGKCPVWQVWEYSSSLNARLAEVSFNFQQALDSCETEDDVQEALNDAASAVEEIAGEKREGAENIESGFGHTTQQSDELNDVAEQLESWAREIESATIPDYPEPEEEDCSECDGAGSVQCTECDGNDPENCANCNADGEQSCDECSGSGTVTPDDPTDEQITEWLDEVRDAMTIVDESPV